MKSTKKGKREVEKLIDYIDYDTKDDSYDSLKERLKEYLPKYNLLRESDLYFGKQKILLSTVHKAKGLEFDNVIITEVVDGIYPNFYSKTESAKKEDYRVLYVALTRAKNRICITAHTIGRYGYEKNLSRFLNCIEDYFMKS